MKRVEIIPMFKSYGRFGSTVPPVSELDALMEQAGLAPSNLGVMLFMSDLCLDRAVGTPSASEEWIGRSRDILQGVVGMTGVSIYGQGSKEPKHVKSHVKAKLRLSELKNWQNAALGEPLEHLYHERLEVLEGLMPLIDRDHKAARPFVIEALPLLLGARLLAQDKPDGWFGRLALQREDRKSAGDEPRDKTKNPNWDTAIFRGSNSTDFMKPTVKLQMKSSAESSTPEEDEKYEKAGIVVIHADEFGLNMIKDVMAGCLNEQGFSPDWQTKAGSSIRPLHPSQLDARTSNLHKAIKSSSAGSVAYKLKMMRRARTAS